MTKTAQLTISRGLAELTRGTNVTVNCVLPGPSMSEGVETSVCARDGDDEESGLHSKAPRAGSQDFNRELRRV
jgi:NAD(P)-dependent dehydrogenase (short-subunit alcohol dehydrogenase family)